MKQFIKNNLTFFSLAAFIFLISAIVYYRIFWRSDFGLHLSNINNYLENGMPKARFLYYWITSIVALKDPANLFKASLLVLASCTALKYIVSVIYLKPKLSTFNISKPYAVIAFFLIFVFPIFIPQYLFFGRTYIGTFTPNIWHNSTTIAVFPFAILLYHLTIKQLNSFSWQKFYAIIFLVAINAYIKPSFLFVYVGALPLTVLIIKRTISSSSLLQIAPILLALILIFTAKSELYDTTVKHGIIFKPFLVYQATHAELSNLTLAFYILASFILSLLFPIYVFIRKRVSFNDPEFVFTSVAMIGALFIYFSFAETGPRQLHGNFGWQRFICSYLLFLVATKKAFKELTSTNIKTPNSYQIIFSFHIIFGLIYIYRLLFLLNYR
ncbi:hypothetical protein QA597_09780 [Marinilabiliaceae bacterium ANBcel2]|nr:hypothetical protein [Marinilabiliaceae bacterium ANBcel2]